ncbi:MAG: dipeptidase [Deltaproteobacteria bacterium]|nr:dipeptidase [Deltaproteobacteria bacterium]
MTIRRYPPILDGHNDSLIKLYLSGYKGHKAFLNGGGKNHLDLPRIKHGGFGGGFFAVFVPSDDEPPEHPGANLNDNGISYDIPLTKPVNPARALEMTIIEMAALFRLADESNGKIKVVRTTREVEACLKNGTIAAILHMEGAEAIDTELNALYVFAEAGLRSVGITWSRSNAFGFGVPFKFPQSPDTGPGLTDIGVRLVKACNSLGIIVDLAHINEQGFWDTARITQAPLVVTHTGVHAICPSSRNLTDKQLDAVGESGGVVGINFHVGFLRADGRLNPDTPIHEIVRHICYVADKIGIDHVAFGSDFDGATIPKDLKDVAGLPKLMSALEKAGFDDEALVKISHENWIRIFKQTWKDQNCQ